VQENLDLNKRKIIELINTHENILILTHKKPDGDAVGATMALARALRNKNNIKIMFEEYNRKFNIINILKDSKEINSDFDIDMINLIIILDCASLDRLGQQEYLTQNKILINIDHHVSNNYFANYNFVDLHASSTSEIIYEFIKDMKLLDKQIASAIYAGIISDTSGFRHPNTSTRTHKIISELLEFKFAFSKIYNRLLMVWMPQETKMLATVIENLELYQEYSFGISYLPYEKIIDRSTGKLIEFIKNIAFVNTAAILIEDKKNICKLSLRSEYLDVNEIAKEFDGGGHKLAAGGVIKSNILEARQKVINAIKAKSKIIKS